MASAMRSKGWGAIARVGGNPLAGMLHGGGEDFPLSARPETFPPLNRVQYTGREYP